MNNVFTRILPACRTRLTGSWSDGALRYTLSGLNRPEICGESLFAARDIPS